MKAIIGGAPYVAGQSPWFVCAFSRGTNSIFRSECILTIFSFVISIMVGGKMTLNPIFFIDQRTLPLLSCTAVKPVSNVKIFFKEICVGKEIGHKGIIYRHSLIQTEDFM